MLLTKVDSGFRQVDGLHRQLCGKGWGECDRQLDLEFCVSLQGTDTPLFSYSCSSNGLHLPKPEEACCPEQGAITQRDWRSPGPAVCFREMSHAEETNVLIGVSGNGRYLTSLIIERGRERESAREGERGMRRVCPTALLLLQYLLSRHPVLHRQLCRSHSAGRPTHAEHSN